MPIPPQTTRRQLTDLQKGKIVGLLESDMPHAEIARQTAIPRRTVRNFITCYQTHETHENLPRSGHHRYTTEAEDRELSVAALANTRLSHAQLKEQTGSILSLCSICRRLRKDHIRKWRA